MMILSIDIGGTRIKSAVMNENAQILKQSDVPSPRSSESELMQTMQEIIRTNQAGVQGIAVCMPGKIDPGRGMVLGAGSFPFLKDYPLAERLSALSGLPVSLCNDGKSAAAAELWQGSMKGIRNGLVYVIGTAIGGGIIINGEVLNGPHFLAGELSNILIDKTRRGFSLDNIAARQGGSYGMLLNYRQKTGSTDMIDGREFFRRLEAGEAAAKNVFEDFCRFTAANLLSLQTVLDLERVAIGGGISAQPAVTDGIREALRELFTDLRKVSHTGTAEPEIVRCRFGNDANLIGALWFFLNKAKEANGFL